MRPAVIALFTLLAATSARADDIFDPKSTLKVEAEGGVGGEGPAWHPDLGVLSSGNGDINRLSRDGKVDRPPGEGGYERPTVRRPRAGSWPASRPCDG